uniref:8 kDa Amblyomma family member n=1 Tax=Rhipicephalus zambeziensis TaxID=60191 RepID=A0A224Y7N0_9ACAR
MVFYRTIALASFVAMLVLMAQRSNTHMLGGIGRPWKSCNQTCRLNDDDSRTSCLKPCICQAITGSDSFPQYGQGLCVKFY